MSTILLVDDDPELLELYSDVLELMAEGRRRVHERFGVVLEPEVQVLGEVRWPAGWDL